MVTNNPKRRPMFVSWRWRTVLPLFLAVLLMAMVSAYLLASRLGGGITISQDNVLLESIQGMQARADDLYEQQLQEAQRIAFTVGVAEAVELRQVEFLQQSLEAMARLGELDSVIVTDWTGVELLGVQRVSIPNVDDYAVNTGTPLGPERLVQSALAGTMGESGLLRTPEGVLVFVSVPLQGEEGIVGAVLAGRNFSTLTADLHGNAVTQTALYREDGTLAGSTLPLTDSSRAALAIDDGVIRQVLAPGADTVPVNSLTVAGTPYRAAYLPFRYGNDTLGVMAAFLPDAVPFATEIGRQLAALMAAAITGTAVTVVFVAVTLFTGRVERVGETAQALAAGQADARTGMQATDEAGAAGAALDAYATRVKQEHDALQTALRRQRREASHLVAVLESMPDGVIVQDMAGNVTLMNDEAREWIGSQAALQGNPALSAMGGAVNKVLGEALAPGIYTLGDPQQVQVGEKMLNAQAAAITTPNGERVGTVIVLRDITEFVKKEQARERLLKEIESEVQSTLPDAARAGTLGAPLDNFAREITKRAVALQKLVVEMRELTEIDAENLQHRQKPILLDTLVWAVANEWRQIAQAADLSLQVQIAKSGLFILGDERRLRWAVGNIVDNAVKYTPPGGAVTLEITGADKGQALLRVRDSGVGIQPDELPKVTTRFYRGNPTTQTGEIIRTPGMGQGLYTARQIFEAHGGMLKVRSKTGTGTAVYFSLPLTASETLDLPVILEAYEGETVRLPEDSIRQEGR